MSFIGKKVEEFSVPAFHNDALTEFSDKDLEGKWSVLFFYPGDFTFVWPTELKDLALIYDKFQKLGVEIYAISTDSEFSHKAWNDVSETIKMVKYPMLSDRSFKLSRQFGVLDELEGQSQRGTFVIGPNKEVVLYEISGGAIGRNAKELLRKIHAAQLVEKNKTQAVPASWQPGEKTLTPGIDLVGKL